MFKLIFALVLAGAGAFVAVRQAKAPVSYSEPVCPYPPCPAP